MCCRVYFCCSSDPWLLTVGALQAQCHPKRKDGVDRLAVSRGLLTCCRPDILLGAHPTGVNPLKLMSKTQLSFIVLAVIDESSSSFHSFQMCLLLKGLFPLVCALCEEKVDCHYFAFEGKKIHIQVIY